LARVERGPVGGRVNPVHDPSAVANPPAATEDALGTAGQARLSVAMAGDRYHGLDALRGLVMLQGIAFHAALPFLAFDVGWPIRDRYTHPVVDVLVWWSSTFRMEVFFILAGFFGHLVLRRRGERAFLANRTVRLGLPLVIGILVLNGAGPPLPDFQNGAWLSPLADWLGRFNLLHLWFLYYLLMLCLLAVAVHRAAASLAHGISARLRAAVSPALDSPVAPLLLGCSTAPLIWATGAWSTPPPIGLIPDPLILCYYGIFFGFGWRLHRREEHLSRLGSATWLNGLAGAILFIGWIWLLHLNQLQLYPESVLRALGSFAAASIGWLMAFTLIGGFMRYLNRPGRGIRYLADSSYWLYLIHLPFIMGLQYELASSEVHPVLKFGLVLGFTVPSMLVSYHLLVRYTWVGNLLHGRRV